MIKRGATPLAKDRYPSKSSISQNKPLREIKNMQPNKPSLSRNSSQSKLLIAPSMTEPASHNPQSADRKSSSRRQITSQMRKTVVEWMLEVSHRSTMRRQTVFMAILLFDNGLKGFKDIGPANAQLLAIAALFMAAKYQEIYPQSLKKFLDYTLNSYQKSEILSMEEKILSLMNFKLTFATRFTHSGLIMERQLSYGPNARKLRSLVVFLLELSLLVEWEDFDESELGQAGVFLAAKVLKYPPPVVSDRIMDAAYRLMGVWRQNEGGIVAYLFDCEKECYVGGLKIIY